VGAIEDLISHLQSFNSAPFLFVGSGLSRRYLGLETWGGLLELMSSLTGQPHAYFVSRGGSSSPDVAAAIADALFDTWWEDERFAESRHIYAEGLRDRESPFKVEVARHVESALANLPTTGLLHQELELLGQAVIDGVITTNYDGLLELIFSDFNVYIGQDELLFSEPQGVAEIYKIHGSGSRPESIVLTRSDFDRFDERNPYLAAKLLTIFVEHPVVFLGYSLSDSNVTDMLVSIARVLTNENLGQLRDRLIFVQWDPDSQTASFSQTVVAVEGFTIPVVSVRVPDFVDLFTMLGDLRRPFPARVLRRLKEHVYELVLNNDPAGRLAVVDIDHDVGAAELEVVFGVGITEQLGLHGYVGLSRHDLLLDVLRQESQYRPDGVLKALPPAPSRQRPHLYRYLRGAGLLDENANLAEDAEIDDRIRDRVDQGREPYLPSPSVRERADRLVQQAGGDLAKMVDDHDVHLALGHFGATPPDKIDFEELRRFLLTTQIEFEGSYSSAWAKLVCLYDYYLYGALAATPPASREQGRT
jgi:hypothetical protein